MNPFSILMFCFSGALFLYAVLLYITKDYKLIPRGYVSKTDDKQAYTKQVAEIVALVAVAPAHCGYIALFSMGWSVVVLIVEMVLVTAQSPSEKYGKQLRRRECRLRGWS